MIPLAIPFAIGIAFLIATLAVFTKTLMFVAGANRTDATFIGSVARSGGNHGGTFLYPRFRFSTDGGRTIEVTSGSGSSDQPYQDGQKVVILYDPRDPAHAEIESIGLWTGTLFLIPFALMFTAIPAVIFVAIRRRRTTATIKGPDR